MEIRKKQIGVIACGLMVAASIIATGAPASASSSGGEQTCSVNYESQETVCVEGDIGDLKAKLLEEENLLLVEADQQGRAEVAEARSEAARGGEVQPMANYVLGVAHENKNYGGATIVFNTTVSTTCKTHSFSWDNLGFAYWQGELWRSVDNQFSSVKPGPGCQMWLYVDANRGGSVYKAKSNVADLGWMDNLASSVWFTG